MRLPRLLIPLTATLAVGLASPAMAADVPIEAVDFEFQPADQRVAVGDTVIWNFVNEGHTTTATRGQAENWNSGPATNAAGTTYQKTFNTPGRFGYICIPHASFMKGTIVVGEDAVNDTVDRLRGKKNGNDVRITYELNEAATVTYKLRGPSTRTVKKGRVRKGKHSFRLRNLKAGQYRGTLTLVDDFDKRATAKNSFGLD